MIRVGFDVVTLYFVQGFRHRGNKLEGESPQPAASAQEAIAAAERLAATCNGVWAYSQNIDTETESYELPVALIKIGWLPAGLGE